jgi:peptide/nickel transport system permease protein
MQRTSLKTFLSRFARNKAAVLGAVIAVIFLIVGIFAPVLAPYDPYQFNLENRFRSPDFTHWMGSDEFGRDILSRIIYGARLSILIGTLGVLLAIVIGVPMGVVSGYCGGRIDHVILGIVDVMLAFPGILLAIAIVSVLGFGLTNVIIAIGVFSIPTYARLTRGAVLSVKNLDYNTSAQALGASHLRIVFHHILPNSLSPLIIQTSLRIATALLTASSLSFLGLGAQPPLPEWGAMLSNGRAYLRLAPHLATFPGLAIMIVVLGFNLMGDGLRDTLDPMMK